MFFGQAHFLPEDLAESAERESWISRPEHHCGLGGHCVRHYPMLCKGRKGIKPHAMSARSAMVRKGKNIKKRGAPHLTPMFAFLFPIFDIGVELLGHKMVSDQNSITENELSKIILDASYRVHSHMGPGLLETVYEVVLAYELRKRGLKAERQTPVPIRYDGLVFEEGFRCDIIVEDSVIVELKSVEALLPVHSKQVLTQLRLSDHKLGLLINFGELHLKNGIKRIVNGLPEAI